MEAWTMSYYLFHTEYGTARVLFNLEKGERMKAESSTFKEACINYTIKEAWRLAYC